MELVSGTVDFDVTVDFENGALQTELARVIAEIGCDGQFMVAIVRADSEVGELYTGELEFEGELTPDDWLVTGKNAAEIATALCALL